MTPPAPVCIAVALLLLVPAMPSLGHGQGLRSAPALLATPPGPRAAPALTNGTAVANFSSALQRLVALVGASGSAVLALVWARVAVSWFSNDVTKKVQAKDRARDALIGSLVFAAALTGLAWGLARWVLTGV